MISKLDFTNVLYTPGKFSVGYMLNAGLILASGHGCLDLSSTAQILPECFDVEWKPYMLLFPMSVCQSTTLVDLIYQQLAHSHCCFELFHTSHFTWAVMCAHAWSHWSCLGTHLCLCLLSGPAWDNMSIMFLVRSIYLGLRCFI